MNSVRKGWRQRGRRIGCTMVQQL